MGHTVNVITSLVIDLVVLCVVVMVCVTVVFASVTQDGKVNHVIAMIQMKHVLWAVVETYVLAVATVNVVSVNALKKMA